MEEKAIVITLISKNRIETLSETKTWSAKIVDTTGEESETVTEEIHVMASPSRLQDEL